MKNKIRLNTVCDLLNSTDTLADIGCDHGYLGILALEKGISFVQFVDNKTGPLNQAKNNLKQYNQ